MSIYTHFRYQYELRRDDQIIATGTLTQEQQLEVGEQFATNGLTGEIREIQPTGREHEYRLIISI